MISWERGILVHGQVLLLRSAILRGQVRHGRLHRQLVRHLGKELR